MKKCAPSVEKQIRLSAKQADQLHELACAQGLTDDELVAQALELLFTAAKVLALKGQRRPAARPSSGAGRPRAITPRSESDRQAAENEVMQRLLEAGVITEIRQRTAELDNFTPIEVRGKPLSELIIEERR